MGVPRLAELAREHLLRRPKQIDEVALERARERGAEADALMKNPLLSEAFTKIEAAYMQAWRTSAMDELDKRERSWAAVLLLADLKNLLIMWVREGEGAAAQLRKAAED